MAFVRGICPHCGNAVNLPEEATVAYCPECGASITCEDAFQLADSPDEASREQTQEATPRPEPQPQRESESQLEPGPQPQQESESQLEPGPQPQQELRRQQELQPEPQSTQPQSPQSPQQPRSTRTLLNPLSTESLWQRSVDTPFLSQWKTDVPFTILGLLLRFMLVWTIINLTGGQAMIDEALQTGVLTPTRAYIIGGGLFNLACAITAFVVIPKRFRKDYEGRNYLVSFVNTLVGGIIFGPYWNSRLTKRRLGISYLVFFVLLATNGLSSITMLMFV